MLVETARLSHGWLILIPGIATLGVQRLRGAEPLVQELVAMHHATDPAQVSVELRPRRLSP